MSGFSLPGAYPLQGTVKSVMEHFFDDVVNPTYCFPPPGKSMDVAYFSSPLTEKDLGTFPREDGDVFFLAWLMKYDTIRKDEEKKAKFLESAESISLRFNFRATEDRVCGTQLLKGGQLTQAQPKLLSPRCELGVEKFSPQSPWPQRTVVSAFQQIQSAS